MLHHFRFIILLLICCIETGCADQPQIVVWDISQGRNISSLNGGKFTREKANKRDRDFIYHIKGHKKLTMTIILPNDKQFDFDSISNAYASGHGSDIETIDIASSGYSEEGVIQRLKEMHLQWNGRGLGDINKWQADSAKRSLRPHHTEIHRPKLADDPSISASIRYNFRGQDERWFIMTTFFWRDLKLDQETAVPTNDTVKDIPSGD